MKAAYLLGAFPTTRETFVSNEVIDLLRRGVHLDVFSWNLPHAEILHPEVAASGVLTRTHYFRYRRLSEVLLSRSFWRALVAVTVGHHRHGCATMRDKLTAAYFATLIRTLGIRHLHWHFVHGYGRLLSELAGVTYSFMSHCYEPRRMDEATQVEVRSLIQAASFVAVASEFVSNGLAAVVGPDHAVKLRLIRCGIDAQRFEPRQDVPKTYDVVCVAGFTPCKGLEYLLKAASLLAARGRSVSVALVGGPHPAYPEYAEWLRAEWHSSRLGGTFELVGAVDSQRVRTLLQRSRIFVLPAIVDDVGHSDGLPVALMEAAATGLPLVSTALAGIPELVQDGVTGLTVPQRDAEALAEALLTLLEDDALRQRLGRCARQRVEQEFTRELNGERLLEALRPFIS